MSKYSSLLAGLLVIVFLPSVDYREVINPATISAHQNLERARYYSGKSTSSPGFTRFARDYSPSISGTVSIRATQRGTTVVNIGTNNEAVNEAGVIGDYRKLWK